MERIFDGEFTLGPFHGYPNRLIGVGASTVLHQHAHDHMAIMDSRHDAEYAVHALLSEGEREIRLKDGCYALIRAGVEHRVSLVKGERGAFVCLFSTYDENGKYLPDPKEPPHG